MPIDVTMMVAWDGPVAQYERYDIIDIVPYVGKIPPSPTSPWVHIHALECPWENIDDMKSVILEPQVDDPTAEEPEIIKPRNLRFDVFSVAINKLAGAQIEQQMTFEWIFIEDQKIFNKFFDQTMGFEEWSLAKQRSNGEKYRVGRVPPNRDG